ncbi:MAG: glycosyltransferase [Anaerolineae bacterium]|nr:glycosyltransferase [Anaerolineae bacterium]MDW8173142.1 glycosyltransferase [Anaerolineae bacterium]
MRTLIVTSSLPYPPASGGALRAYGIIQGLAHAGHDLTLLSFHDGTPDPTQTPLAHLCRAIVTVPSPPPRHHTQRLRDLLLSNRADIACRLYSPVFEARLAELLRQPYDLIQFEGIEIGLYMPQARRAAPQAQIIFDTFNAEADLQAMMARIERAQPVRWPAALYSWIQAQRIVNYEGALCRMADGVIAVSVEDQTVLRAYRNDGKTFVLPSGIFVQDYQAKEHAQLPAHALVFTGKMDYRPNVDAMLWFHKTILPRLPQAHLVIVGQKPTPRLQTLAQRGRVSLTGWVDSVTPYLRAAQVYVAPLRMGSGTRLKLLEAMACGCAIVATSTAASGLSEQARAAMLLADDACSFAQAVQSLLDNPERRAALGQQARAAVAEAYDWPRLIPRLLAIYAEVQYGQRRHSSA